MNKFIVSPMTPDEHAERVQQMGWEALEAAEVKRMVEEVFAQLVSNGAPSPEDIAEAGARVGRNQGPELVWGLHELDLLTSEAAASAVASAWSGVELPMFALDRDDWITLFIWAGFTIDGRAAPRPRGGRRRLYRGAHPRAKDGMSWTESRELADWFAHEAGHRLAGGRVWTALVPPHALLARFTSSKDSGHRGEREWVVDTTGLEIVEWQPASSPQHNVRSSADEF